MRLSSQKEGFSRRPVLIVLLLCIANYSCSQSNEGQNTTTLDNTDKSSISSKNKMTSQDFPTYKLSTARSLSIAPPLLNLNEPGREGIFRLDETDKNSLDNGATTLVTVKGKRYKRVYDNEINVRWFGAVGNGITDDKIAIQKTIDYAKTLSAVRGGTYRQTITFPAGFYYLSSPIDITEANGVWLKGSSGRYINTGFIGNTGKTILDFSGSTMSGCEGFTFLSLGTGDSRSTIGVLFALTNKGGLNCSIKNCYFKLENSPKANGGLGTIGILNIRSEEFSASDCVINANTPVILSNESNLSNIGSNITITSSFAQLATGAGSMGVASFNGQMSLQAIEKYQPALILNGTNTVRFDGYIGRVSQASGNDGPAILCSQSTSNLSINATVESYSQILQVKTSLLHASLNIVSANAVDKTQPLLNFSGASLIDGLTIKVHLPVVAERTNRYLLYHTAVNNGDGPVRTKLMNSEVYCSDLTSNRYVITGNLLKAADNIEFNTLQPFAKKAGSIIQNYTNKVSCGRVGNVTAATAVRFNKCDRTTTKTNNGGFYTIKIDGVIRAGSYGSGGTCTQRFNAIITMSQSQNGNYDASASTITLLGKSQVSPAYVDVKSIAVNLDFEDGIGIVKIKPVVSGTGKGEEITYQGIAEVTTDFLVNDAIIFK